MAGNGRTETRGQVVGEIHSMGENQRSTAKLGAVFCHGADVTAKVAWAADMAVCAGI
jgi:hypothetical protein